MLSCQLKYVEEITGAAELMRTEAKTYRGILFNPGGRCASDTCDIDFLPPDIQPKAAFETLEGKHTNLVPANA